MSAWVEWGQQNLDRLGGGKLAATAGSVVGGAIGGPVGVAIGGMVGDAVGNLARRAWDGLRNVFGAQDRRRFQRAQRRGAAIVDAYRRYANRFGGWDRWQNPWFVDYPQYLADLGLPGGGESYVYRPGPVAEDLGLAQVWNIAPRINEDTGWTYYPLFDVGARNANSTNQTIAQYSSVSSRIADLERTGQGRMGFITQALRETLPDEAEVRAVWQPEVLVLQFPNWAQDPWTAAYYGVLYWLEPESGATGLLPPQYVEHWFPRT